MEIALSRRYPASGFPYSHHGSNEKHLCVSADSIRCLQDQRISIFYVAFCWRRRWLKHQTWLHISLWAQKEPPRIMPAIQKPAVGHVSRFLIHLARFLG